jgi:predicted ribosomally synthesized peptide with nif11-like leader
MDDSDGPSVPDAWRKATEKAEKGGSEGYLSSQSWSHTNVNKEVLQVSVKNLKQYGKLCSEDDAVRKKAKEIGMKDTDGHIAHAKSLGLEISKEDFAALAKEAGLDGKNELSEEELKKVAGGVGTTTMLVVAAGMAVAGGVSGSVLANQPKW